LRSLATLNIHITIIDMNRINSLTNALSTYLERQNTPYAIMINGGWGVGKTYYLLNTLTSNYTEYQFHYLSLYGLTSVKEIEERIGNQIKSQSAEQPPKTQVVCLDDLERWHGNIEHCFSYVNQLVEHLNCKCILVGNLDEISKESNLAFSRAQEKVIRQIYHFNPPIDEILKISLSLVEPVNKTSQRFLRSLVKSNQLVLQRYLTSISVCNIRIVTEALQLFELVYRHHPGTFKKSPGLAFTYLMALLSLLLLVKRHILEKGNRSKLLDEEHANNKGFKFLAEIGYFDESLSSGLTQQSKILLDTIFSRLDKISLRGLCSIVKNGFYLKADFKSEFDQWKDDDHFELYLDTDRFYELENDQAELVFQQILEVLITRREVKNPVTLLLLTERVVNDIATGVIDYNPVLFRKQVLEVIDKLYEKNDMTYVANNIFDLAGDRFINCRAIYNYIVNRNNECLSRQSKINLGDFWHQIFNSPDISDSLIKEFPPTIIFGPTIDLREVLKGLGKLSNIQLNRVVNWIELGIDLSVDSIDTKTIKKMKLLARWLYLNYANAVGIKANHLRRLSRALSAPPRLK
jgi:hypothetical protein